VKVHRIVIKLADQAVESDWLALVLL